MRRDLPKPVHAASKGVRAACCAAACLVSVGAAHSADAVERLFVRTEIVLDENSPPGRRSFFADPVVFAAQGPVYAELNVGSFARGLEVGGWLRDRRGSYYAGFVRRRQGGFVDDTAAEVQTNQKLGRFVAQGFLRAQWPDRPDDDNLLLVPGLGTELYTSSYSFVAFRATLDPRPNAGVTLLLSNRIAARNWFVEGVLAPRSDGVLNYGLRGRWRWIYLGYARDNDFDFTRIDRSVWILGCYYEPAPTP